MPHSRFVSIQMHLLFPPVAMASIAHYSPNVRRWRWHFSNSFPPILSTFPIPMGFSGQAIAPIGHRPDFAVLLSVQHNRLCSIHRFPRRPLPNGCSQRIFRNFDASNDYSKWIWINFMRKCEIFSTQIISVFHLPELTFDKKFSSHGSPKFFLINSSLILIPLDQMKTFAIPPTIE